MAAVEPREGDVLPLPIDPQIVSQQAQSTIKSLQDAIVELVTNSDDSYRRLEEGGTSTTGEIRVYVHREKGGACRGLKVSDDAEGMDWKAAERAITFAAPASGFFEGRTVRGLFGRGLKEAIVGLGSGEIRTIRDGKETEIVIFVKAGAPKFRVTKKERPTGEPSGTQIAIEVSAPRIRCPKYDILHRQLSNHFALRDILCNPKRLVRLRVDDSDGRRTGRLQFEEPQGSVRISTAFNVKGLGKARLEIAESPKKLEFIQGDPGSVAGILVKTDGAIVDSRLFGFDAEEAAHYFYGWVDCPGIAEAIRRGDFGILDPNRSGLDWRHLFCRALNEEVRRHLTPLIRDKRRQLDRQSSRGIREEYKRRLSDLCRLLNALAESELEDLPPWGFTGNEINTLTIRPEVGYAEPDQPRTFSVYLPSRLPGDLGVDAKVAVELDEVKGDVRLLTHEVLLRQHQKYRKLLVGQLQAVGSSFGDAAYILARLGRLEDIAEIRVRAPRRIRRVKPTGTNRGLFRDIEFDETPEPIQRVAFADGIIRVFRRFPPIDKYINVDGVGMDTPQGSLMVAELVAEAFCKEVARRRIDSVAPPIAGSEVDHFNSQVNQLMYKHLGMIHEVLVV